MVCVTRVVNRWVSADALTPSPYGMSALVDNLVCVCVWWGGGGGGGGGGG